MGEFLLEKVFGQRVAVPPDLLSLQEGFAECPFDSSGTELLVQGFFGRSRVARLKPLEQFSAALRRTFGFGGSGGFGIVQFDKPTDDVRGSSQLDFFREHGRYARLLPF